MAARLGVRPALAQSGSSLRDILDGNAQLACGLRNGEQVRKFYELRDYEPAWSASSDSTVAVGLLREAHADGLDPATFALDAIAARQDLKTAGTGSEFELLLTDSMLSYVNAMRGARSLTARQGPYYDLPIVSYDPVDVLLRAVGGDGLQDLPLTAAPSHVEYAQIKRAGLAQDGKAGAAGDGPIIANMERWRWVPNAFEDTCIVVNSADATLKFIREGQVTLESRIVAGKATTPTPLFRTEVSAVIVNPSWDIPGDIADKEIWPAARRHKGYFSARHIVADRPGGALRQLPGPTNALGRIMLDMPNRFDSYLHDTPHKALFTRQDRHFSHGCMRVEQMEALASCLLHGDSEDGADDLREAIADGQTQRLSIPEAVPVYVLYWTTVPSENGALNRHRDIYGWDKKVLEALRAKGGDDPDSNSDCPSDGREANLPDTDENQ